MLALHAYGASPRVGPPAGRSTSSAGSEPGPVTANGPSRRLLEYLSGSNPLPAYPAKCAPRGGNQAQKYARRPARETLRLPPRRARHRDPSRSGAHAVRRALVIADGDQPWRDLNERHAFQRWPANPRKDTTVAHAVAAGNTRWILLALPNFSADERRRALKSPGVEPPLVTDTEKSGAACTLVQPPRLPGRASRSTTDCQAPPARDHPCATN